MFRKPKFIIVAAVALYAVALAVAWAQGTARAEKRVQIMLEAADEGYAAVINGEVEAVLRTLGGAVIDILGGECRAVPSERLKELAKTLNIDEINVVDRRGVVIGSNIDAIVGTDFHETPQTREFCSLVDSSVSLVTQPFRPSVDDPQVICKYYGMSFPRRDGFLQLGMTVDRLRQNIYSYTEAEADRLLKEWHFSVVGWYERADRDPDFESGKVVRRWSDECGGAVIGRYFDYQGYHYIALLPASYCYSQRNADFVVTVLVLTMLIAFFTFILVRLATTSAKLESMHVAAAERNAADLALAKTIQMSALPASEVAFLDRLEFSFTAESHPAREVGGDFYDFYELPGGRLAFLVADVSGKGIPGAMFMMEAKNILKNCLTEYADIAEAVTAANARICERNRAELFVTAWIGAFDPKSGDFEYVNAGHNRPFVRRADGSVEKVMGKGGRFLGMFEDAEYRANVLRLGRGDLLYLYTDGITEAMNAHGEQFGERRLCAALTGYNADLRNALREFVGTAEQSDDLTSLTLLWNGEPERLSHLFPCEDASLAAAVEFIRAALKGQEPKTVAKLLNAADEITSNIVSYSGAADFTVTVEKTPDRLRLTFSDSGKAYNPLSHADPDTHAAIEDRQVGGLGLVVVKRLVDRVAYMRKDGCNILTLIKRISVAAT